MQKSMFALSGRSWAQALMVWSLFALIISGLASEDQTGSDSDTFVQHQAGAAKLSDVLRRTLSDSARQVPHVQLSTFDVSGLPSAAFGDNDDAPQVN